MKIRQGILGGVTARAVAAVVAEGDGLDQGHVEPAGPGDGRGDLRHLEGVGQPGALVIGREDEHLGLAGQAPEGGGVQDAVPVALEAGPPLVGLPPAGPAARRPAARVAPAASDRGLGRLPGLAVEHGGRADLHARRCPRGPGGPRRRRPGRPWWPPTGLPGVNACSCMPLTVPTGSDRATGRTPRTRLGPSAASLGRWEPAVGLAGTPGASPAHHSPGKAAYHGAGPHCRKENPLVDVRIGVTHTPKEIEVELADGTNPDAVVHQIEQALQRSERAVADRPSGPAGRRPGRDRVAYVELNTSSEDRRVGFGAAVR